MYTCMCKRMCKCMCKCMCMSMCMCMCICICVCMCRYDTPFYVGVALSVPQAVLVQRGYHGCFPSSRDLQRAKRVSNATTNEPTTMPILTKTRPKYTNKSMSKRGREQIGQRVAALGIRWTILGAIFWTNQEKYNPETHSTIDSAKT